MPPLISSALLFVQTSSAISVILLVLLQQGKGSGVDSFFGTSAGGFFGSVGATSFIYRMTKWVSSIFFLSTIGLSYLDQWHNRTNFNLSIMEGTSNNILSDAEEYEDQMSLEKDQNNSVPNTF